jgi:hypothetical protein
MDQLKRKRYCEPPGNGEEISEEVENLRNK